MDQNYSQNASYASPVTGHSTGADRKTHSCSGSSAQSGEMYYPQYQSNDYYYQYGADGYGYVPETYNEGIKSWFDFTNSCYLKGLLVGAGAALILGNSNVQKALVKGTVKAWSFVQGGVEEVKEQFRDAKAEMSQDE